MKISVKLLPPTKALIHQSFPPEALKFNPSCKISRRITENYEKLQLVEAGHHTSDLQVTCDSQSVKWNSARLNVKEMDWRSFLLLTVRQQAK